MMTPEDLEGLAAGVPLAPGYRFTALQRREIRLLTDSVKRWFPEISVGSAACYLRESFYERKAFFADAPDRNHIIMLLKHGQELAGMFACRLDHETLAVYAGLGVSGPGFRGANLAHAGMAFTDAGAILRTELRLRHGDPAKHPCAASVRKGGLAVDRHHARLRSRTRRAQHRQACLRSGLRPRTRQRLRIAAT